MLKSLSSGVSGLQAHQIAMDVESNNIANVNTVGFKYSRANFSNLLSQVNQIATAPQGDLGGKNSTGVGLGTTVSSMTRIDSQGSVQNTDKNTDCAIQGDGFFVVSSDGGKTNSYTRNGDFSFDASGNFVDNNGYVVQGWLRDPVTGKVDSTAPIAPISIPPGLTTPAQASTEVVLKANLDSGATVNTFGAISALDSVHGGIDLNGNGTLDAPGELNNETSNLILQDANGLRTEHAENMNVMVDGSGNALLLQNGQGENIGFKSAQVSGSTPALSATVAAAGDININGYDIPAVTTSGVNAVADLTLVAAAINSMQTSTGVTATVDSTVGSEHIVLSNDNSGSQKNISVTTTGNGTAVSGLTNGATDAPMKSFIYTDGSVNQVGWNGANDTYYFTTSEDLRNGLQQLARDYNNPLIGPTVGGPYTADQNPLATVTVDSAGKFQVSNPDSSANGKNINITVTPVTSATTIANTTFNSMIGALSGSLPAGSASTRSSQAFNVPTHSASIDVYDSLGSKHTVKIDFRKSSFDPTQGSTWDVTVTVPIPSTLNASPAGTLGEPSNIVIGSVEFNPDGSLRNASNVITNLTFSGNNGSLPNQPINLSLGTTGAFDGLTSFDSKSATSGISQDGYTGGDLVGIRIDQSGTLVGSFTNGRSFGLAQIAMAKFANNGGLSADGGNLYTQSANSGDPIYGTAATGGRGFIQSSALESSNVDLSRSLTELIVIQRGYQANSKTITTSDQLLQTLIGLKQ
ncbi:MAG: flagellar hook protein FlgE [Thiovulaceae bacterium]|nr:flagellar hook protein FlgE [Sulfurimonadaceae bacterium]